MALRCGPWTVRQASSSIGRTFWTRTMPIANGNCAAGRRRRTIRKWNKMKEETQEDEKRGTKKKKKKKKKKRTEMMMFLTKISNFYRFYLQFVFLGFLGGGHGNEGAR